MLSIKEPTVMPCYWIITTFMKEEHANKTSYRKDDHLYPAYLANYNLDINRGMCIQSGIYDAIKFVHKSDALRFKEKAESIFKEHVIELTRVSQNIFGKPEVIRFVYKGQKESEGEKE